MEVLFVLLVLSLIGWTVYVQISARQQVDVVTTLSEQDAAQEVLRYFGVLWTQVPGRGHVNYRPKLRADAPTMSINFSPDGTAACVVSIWTSHWTKRYGLMSHAQLMWRKKRGLAARLASASDTTANWSTGA